MLTLYIFMMEAAFWPLRLLLAVRARRGKEDPKRLGERMGFASLPRPPGPLIWLHAASVGEAQSILSLIEALLALTSANIVLTSGTVTSARFLAVRLPPRAVHQYFPIDRPGWAKRFLDHWRPDLALFTESELWPAMLTLAARREVPLVLVNGRLSPRSYRRWTRMRRLARRLIGSFRLILTQTAEDAMRFRALGGENVHATGNLKYGAAPLPVDELDLELLRAAMGDRPLWLYASTHAGEEEMAVRLHHALRVTIPRLLTVIVPRHPSRAPDVATMLDDKGMRFTLRGVEKERPDIEDGIYLAGTLGELGLFYRLAPVCCVGRSFSADGGGGHNPLEPAQLGCAVLHGPAVQNLAAIYDEMDRDGAAIRVPDEGSFAETLHRLLGDWVELQAQQARGRAFVARQAAVLDHTVEALAPILKDL